MTYFTRLPYARWLVLWLSIFVLCACATRGGSLQALPGSNAHWQGRLAVKVFGNPVQAWAANFELVGNPAQGELILTTPLGGTLAHLQWTAGKALLKASNQQQEFSSLDALALQATGTPLPIAAMFGWLSGKSAEATGWELDSGGLQNGRLTARQTAQEPQAEIKIVLDK
jgi:outer membrane lipoprotein LolB